MIRLDGLGDRRPPAAVFWNHWSSCVAVPSFVAEAYYLRRVTMDGKRMVKPMRSMQRTIKAHAAMDAIVTAVLVGSFVTAVGCGEGRSVSALSAELGDSDPDVRYEAAKALEDFGPQAEGAIPELAEALQDSSPKVRYRAAKAISKIESGLEPAVPALGRALSDSERDVRYYAAKALDDADADAELVVAEIGAALEKEKDDEVRYYLVKSLRNLGSKAEPAMSALKKASKAGDEEVRRAAKEALDKIER